VSLAKNRIVRSFADKRFKRVLLDKPGVPHQDTRKAPSPSESAKIVPAHSRFARSVTDHDVRLAVNKIAGSIHCAVVVASEPVPAASTITVRVEVEVRPS